MNENNKRPKDKKYTLKDMADWFRRVRNNPDHPDADHKHSDLLAEKMYEYLIEHPELSEQVPDSVKQLDSDWARMVYRGRAVEAAGFRYELHCLRQALRTGDPAVLENELINDIVSTVCLNRRVAAMLPRLRDAIEIKAYMSLREQNLRHLERALKMLSALRKLESASDVASPEVGAVSAPAATPPQPTHQETAYDAAIIGGVALASANGSLVLLRWFAAPSPSSQANGSTPVHCIRGSLLPVSKAASRRVIRRRLTFEKGVPVSSARIDLPF